MFDLKEIQRDRRPMQRQYVPSLGTGAILKHISSVFQYGRFLALIAQLVEQRFCKP